MIVVGLIDYAKRAGRNVNRGSQIGLGFTVLALGAFSAVPIVCAIGPATVDANGYTLGHNFGRDDSISNDWPFQKVKNLTLAVESPGEENEADKLAKQLANPIASLISVPFQANEDWGYGPSGNGYKFTLNIQPVIPISISKNWNMIVRTILPIVSQHDLFYVPNLPNDSPLQPQNRSQDGLSDTLQSFFFSPKKSGPFGLIWGIGPALLYPTGTHPLLDTGTFSIGPTIVVLKQQGPWTVGALMNQLWSVVIGNTEAVTIQCSFNPLFLTQQRATRLLRSIRNRLQTGTLPPTTGNGPCRSFSKSVRF